MITKRAINYYLSSIPTLIRETNFLSIPLVLVKKPILIRLKNGLRFNVYNLMDIWTLKEVILDKQYEQVRRLRGANIVIDIGSSIGDFSILASKTAKKVYSFEMDKNRVLLMKKNMSLNSCGNIDLNEMRVNSLNDIFKEKGIKKCDFLKIDCEGGEYQIFNNADKDTLNKINFIAMEAHLFDGSMDNQFKLLKTKLQNNGFRIKEIPNKVHSYIKFLFAYQQN